VPTTSIDGERATKVSLDRPMAEPRLAGTFLDWDVYTVEWLEQAGYDVTYSTDIDTDLHPQSLLKHKAFVSAGHDEYWTRQMYDAVETARDSGVNLAFLGADAVHSQVRLEPSTTHEVPDRVIVCYRDANLDPTTDPLLKTVEWRDPLLNRPQQGLIGVQYSGGLASNAPFIVQSTAASWVYADTGFRDGDQSPNIVGYETDGFNPAYPPPLNITRTLLSSSPYVDNFGNPVVSNASLYEAERSRAWVFASGTMSWSWALARPDYIDARVQHLTQNVFDRFVAGGVTRFLRHHQRVRGEHPFNRSEIVDRRRGRGRRWDDPVPGSLRRSDAGARRSADLFGSLEHSDERTRWFGETGGGRLCARLDATARVAILAERGRHFHGLVASSACHLSAAPVRRRSRRTSNEFILRSG
jgi:hypothetical protein